MFGGRVSVRVALMALALLSVALQGHRNGGVEAATQLPVVVAGWDCKGCIQRALEMLQANASAVDAAVAGCEVAEQDTSVNSVCASLSPNLKGFGENSLRSATGAAAPAAAVLVGVPRFGLVLSDSGTFYDAVSVLSIWY